MFSLNASNHALLLINSLAPTGDEAAEFYVDDVNDKYVDDNGNAYVADLG